MLAKYYSSCRIDGHHTLESENIMAPTTSLYSTSTLDVEQATELLEKQSLSDDESYTNESMALPSFSTKTCSRIVGLFRAAIPYTLSIVFLILYLNERERRPNCADLSQGIYSPAQSAIKYEIKVFAENFATKGPYMGQELDGIPNNETDQLWEELYQCMASTSSRLYWHKIFD
jgi:hypothetical protein